MSLVQFDFESQYLHSNTVISVILPDRPRTMEAADFYASGKKYKVLWLLHGTFGDHSDWVRKSMIELYAAEKNLICVMPSALNSDYVNWPGFAMGYDMDSHLVKELMPLIHNWFPASSDPKDNFIAGLSMGGRGTLHYLLKSPHLFAAGAILSYAPAPLDRADWDGTAEKPGLHSWKSPRFRNQVANAGGKEAYMAGYDDYKTIFTMHREGTLPKMLFGCGTADFLYPDFCRLRQACEAEQVPIRFETLPDLGHEWRFWDPFIQTALTFFGLDEQEQKAGNPF